MNLSIKNVPTETVYRLRARAAKAHRSLQGELLHIVQDAVENEGPADLDAISLRIRALGLPRVSESTAIIREARDER